MDFLTSEPVVVGIDGPEVLCGLQSVWVRGVGEVDALVGDAEVLPDIIGPVKQTSSEVCGI